MNDSAPPTGPPPPTQIPQGWKPGWSDQYQEHFYTNIHTGQSQWEQPSHPVMAGNAPPSTTGDGHDAKGFTHHEEALTGYDAATKNDPPPYAGNGNNNFSDTKQESHFLTDYEFEESGSSQALTETSVGWSRKRSCRVMVKRFDRSKDEEVAKADREIAALSSLSDPGIPPLLEVFDSPTIRFLVLESRTDESLKQYVASHGSIAEDLVKALLTQLFAALAATFMAGFTHLRICDETLFIDKTGQLTLKDFHYAHPYNKEVEGRQYALVQVKYGSDIYVAPEVFVTESYNGRKAALWSCGVVLYYMVTAQTEKLSNIEHPTNNNMPDSSQSSSRRESVADPNARRRSSLSLGGRKLSISKPPTIIQYPGTSRFGVPNYARDIISKLLLTNPLKRAELIEVAAKVPKEFASKDTRPLMELAWLDYKTHVGPLAGMVDVGEDDNASIFSGMSGMSMSNPFSSMMSRRRSSIKNTPPQYS